MQRKHTCTLIIGNGFSLGLARFLKATDLFCLDVLLPTSNSPLYYPHSSGYEPPRKLWSPTLFPKLLQAWDDWLPSCPPGTSDRDKYLLFCEKLAEGRHINTGKADGKFNLYTGDLSYHLRCFLWCVFKFNCFMLHREPFVSKMRQWGWTRVLRELSDRYYLRIISFNYDCFVETALQAAGVPQSIYCDSVNDHYLNGEPIVQFDRNHCHVVKPHGAVFFETITAIRMGYREPWTTTNAITDARMLGGTIRLAHGCPTCPMLPDIVPPGHSGDHFANPNVDYSDIITKWLSESAALVLCGLSAAKPDTKEFATIIGAANAACPAIHVGLGNKASAESDENNDAGRILRETSRPYSFIDVSRDANAVKRVPELLRWYLRK